MICRTALGGALALAASVANADTAFCIEARDQACIIEALPAASLAGIEASPFAAEMLYRDPLIDLRQWPHAPAVLDPFIDFEIDEGWPLIEAYGFARDPDALKIFAQAIGFDIYIRNGMRVMIMLAAAEGDGQSAEALMARGGSTLPDVAFILANDAASRGDFETAYSFAARTSAEGHSATLQRIAWYAAMSGDVAQQARAADALLNIHATAPMLFRPTVLEQIHAILAWDIDAQVANLEASALPEIAEDLEYQVIHSVLAGLLILSIGEEAYAGRDLIDGALAALSDDMRAWNSELDDVLVQLAAAAFQLGHVEVADQIFALRDDGAMNFQSNLFALLDDETAAHFIGPAVTQLRHMVDGHLSGRQPVEYMDYKLSEGLYSDLSDLCDTLIRVGQPFEAKALYAWAEETVAMFEVTYSGSPSLYDGLYFRCHTDATSTRDRFAPERLERPSFTLAYAAYETGNFDALEQALLVFGPQAGTDVLVTLAENGGDPALRPLVQRFLGLMRADEDVTRAMDPTQGDHSARYAMVLGLLYGLDGSGDDFRRITDEVERTVAMIWALWAIDPKPRYAQWRLGDGAVWYMSKVSVLPAFFTY